MKKAILEPKSVDRIVVPAGFNKLVYEPRFVLSAAPKLRNLSGLLKRLEPLERLKLS